MTDRYNALIVVLEKDIRDDDAEFLIDAIKWMKGVLDVKGNVANVDQMVAGSRFAREMRGKLLDMVRELEQGDWG